MGLRVYVEWLVREEEVGCELMHTCDEGVAVMAKSTTCQLPWVFWQTGVCARHTLLSPSLHNALGPRPRRELGRLPPHVAPAGLRS